MDFLTILITVIIVLAIYFGVITYMKNKKPKKITESNIDVEALICALGGRSNIVSTSHSPSKLSVVLKDSSLTDVETIKSIGASGIVEGKDSLSLIFGKSSEAIENDIKTLIK